MRQRNSRLVISFNSDGEEAPAAKKTLHDLFGLLSSLYDISLIELKKKNWLEKTIKLISRKAFLRFKLFISRKFI